MHGEDRDERELLGLGLRSHEPAGERDRDDEKEHRAEQRHRHGAAPRLREPVLGEYGARARLHQGQQDAETSRDDQEDECERAHVPFEVRRGEYRLFSRFAKLDIRRGSGGGFVAPCLPLRTPGCPSRSASSPRASETGARSTAYRSGWRRARSSACSAPTAPGRPPSSEPSRAASSRTAAASRSSACLPCDDRARSARGWVPQEIALYPLLSPRENLVDLRPLPGARGNGARRRLSGRASSGSVSPTGSNDKTDAAVGRHEAAAQHRRGHDPRPEGASPRRADRRRRPAVAGADLRHDRRAQARGASPSSTPRTTWRRPSGSATASRSSTTEGSSPTGPRTSSSARPSARAQALTIDTGRRRSRRPSGRSSKRAGRARRRDPDPAHGRRTRPRRSGELLETFHARGASVRDLTLKSPTLEQVFLHLTGRELRE